MLIVPSRDDICAYRFPARDISLYRHTDVLEDILTIPDEVIAGNLNDSIVGRKSRKSHKSVAARTDWHNSRERISTPHPKLLKFRIRFLKLRWGSGERSGTTSLSG